MIILLTLIAIVITGVPLAAAVLVTVASRREETARSIARRAPGPLERAARRLLAFQATASAARRAGPGPGASTSWPPTTWSWPTSWPPTTTWPRTTTWS